jgi:hypothetical protein
MSLRAGTTDNLMLRALVTFVVALVGLLLALGQFGLVGPYETALVVALAVVAAGLVNRKPRRADQ